MSADRRSILRRSLELEAEVVRLQNAAIKANEQLALYREELKGLVWLEKVNIGLRFRISELEQRLTESGKETP